MQAATRAPDPAAPDGPPAPVGHRPPAARAPGGSAARADRAARGSARFGDLHLADVVDHVELTGPRAVRPTSGTWAVVGDFSGVVRAWRFARVRRSAPVARAATAWEGPPAHAWTSSLDAPAYRAAVEEVRRRVREGDVYQVNVCRVLAAPLPAHDREPSAAGLDRVLATGNPAPFAGFVHVPAGGHVPPVWVVTASPELFLEVSGNLVRSGPIKGTAAAPSGLTDKDRAENVMITDMVRNDLQHACRPGTVEVEHLLETQHHPGLVHLVSTVRGRLRDPGDWTGLLAATYPPASVSGAPRHTALRAIADLEPADRGPYCGAVGWLDADAGTARLAVGIRTFWWDARDGGTLRFGTGAGITWDSDAGAEWAETELKAARLVSLAGRTGEVPG